jgi:acetoin utilization protein AcuB
MNVSTLMKRSVVVVSPEDTVRRALEMLEDLEIRHLPVVVDGDTLVGIVSDRDLREFRLPVLEELAHPEFADALMARKVGDAMNAQPVLMEEHEGMGRAIDLMIAHGIGAIPVVAKDSRALVGIISYVDVLAAVRSSF